MIDLIKQQILTYPHHTVADRLKQAGLTLRGYTQLCNWSETQQVRESAITEEDVKEAVDFFIKHPDLGAGKAHLTLIDQEKARMSTTNLNFVKRTLALATAKKYKERKEVEKLLETQLRKDLAARGKGGYKHKRANYANHIWAIDFVNITFLGIAFGICVIFDEFTQNYMAIQVGLSADHELAEATFREALAHTSKEPVYLRRDNGEPFKTEVFQQALGNIEDYPIPPRSPWFNGSLESCNGSLKAAVKTTGMQDMAEDGTPFRKARKNPQEALKTLQGLVARVRTMLNQDISRAKHKMPPARAYTGGYQATLNKRNAFLAKKSEERTVRMKEIRAKPEGKRHKKTLIDKTRHFVNQAIAGMNTNSLYVLDEAIHKRYQMFET